MTPMVPRLHLFEIADQTWFPSFLRAHVQAGLTHAWTTRVPILQSSSPATLVANILRRELDRDGDGVQKYTYIDFCAGAGGPTPYIEQALNQQIATSSKSKSRSRSRSKSSPSLSSISENEEGNDSKPSYAEVASQDPTPSNPSHSIANGQTEDNKPSYAEVASQDPTPSHSHSRANGQDKENQETQPVKFILTDLHPHIQAWAKASSQSPHLTYIRTSVNAASAPAELIQQSKTGGKGVFRLFNLAFHHFDDKLARAILKNTVETSDGFGIFELQSRNISSLISCTLFGIFIFLITPLLYWWSPQILFFVHVVPIVPFVLVFDGYISSLRTRTPSEVEVLLRTCGAKDTSDWVVRSGSERFLWPCGYLNWVICTKQKNSS